MAMRKAPYLVGYRKPPTATQFRKGKSGNPRGRPNGRKNFTTILEETLDTTVVVNEGGKRVTRSKRDVVATQLVNKAAGGDLKAAELVIKLSTGGGPEGGVVRPDLATDREMSKILFARLKRVAAVATSSTDDDEPPEDTNE